MCESLWVSCILMCLLMFCDLWFSFQVFLIRFRSPHSYLGFDGFGGGSLYLSGLGGSLIRGVLSLYLQ